MPKLVIFRGDAVEQEVRLTGSPVRIGRHARNEIVLDDGLNGVSRFHAEVRAEGGTYFIVDTNSRNGVWINGRRIKDRAALALGVPATVGGFELALEDDVSTGEFDEPFAGQPTVVSVVAPDHREAASRPVARPRPARSPLTPAQRQTLLWSAVGAATLLICLVTFAIVRNRPRPPVVAVVEPSLPVLISEPLQTPPLTGNDVSKTSIEKFTADARAEMDARDYDGAVRDAQAALELDPENAAAGDLKRRAEEAIVERNKAPRSVAKPVEVTEVETQGISRKPNEVWAEYQSRVARVLRNFSEGKNSLDKNEFALALAHFRLVERDQPKYLGVDLLIAETVAKQQKALEEAISGGQQNEAAGKPHDARQWYERALVIDPTSTTAREKNAALLNRMTADANKLFDRASFALKSGDPTTAIGQWQKILDLMSPGDEIREKAQKQLEGLKK